MTQRQIRRCARFSSVLLSVSDVCVVRAVVFAGTAQAIDFFVGDVSSYTLHNLQPGTTYDVKVIAQYTGGVSAPLSGQGTTRMYSSRVTHASVGAQVVGET